VRASRWVLREAGGEIPPAYSPVKVQKFRVPTPLAVRKATWTGASTRVPGQPGAVEDTGMCGRSLFGNREISRLTRAACRHWPASGRRGAVADDARPREVRLRHSSYEVGEQSRATDHGADGAKGGGQGKCEPATHAPGAGPGKRVTGTGAHTESCKGKEEGTVHVALLPSQPGNSADRILRSQARGSPRRRRADVAGLRDRPRSQGGDLFAGDQAVVQPTVQGRGCNVQDSRRCRDGHDLAFCSARLALETGDAPVVS
jgi:hypothetical protein